MSGPVALVAYPLSHGYRAELERAAGGPLEVLSLSELRRLPLPRLVRTIASLRGRRCLLPLEDPASRALAPVLESLAAAGFPASLELVGPDLRFERVPRLHAAVAPAGVAAASLSARSALRACRRELEGLLAAERAPMPRLARRSVLHVNGSLWFGVKAGGSIAHTAGVANALSELGFEVEVAAAGRPGTLHPEVAFRGLEPPRVFALPVETNYWRFQRLVARQLDAAAAGTGLLYHRLSVASYTGPLLARAHGLPLVVEYNGSEVWIQRHWGRPLRYERLAEDAEQATLRHAHLLVTVSEPLRDELLERGVEPERVVFYPNCVDPGLFDPERIGADAAAEVRARHGIPADAVLATFVGSFGQWHGVDVLARAIRLLVARDADWLASRRVRFLLVGDGLKMAEVREILGDACGDVVTLPGLVPQADAPAYLAASDLLLSPHVANPDGTPFFGSPTKLFEYMAVGRGIVASRLDQIADVLRPALDAAALPERGPDGAPEQAVLTAPGDVEQLVDGIRFLVERPDWRRALGENARTRVLERYTWRHHVEAILDRLAELGA